MSGPQQMLMAGGTSSDLNPLWSNVVLALHGDGTNGSTSIVDEKGNTITRIGTPTITTAQSQFGGASIDFSNGGITVGGDVHNTAFDFGIGDFCVRGWLRSTSDTEMVFYDSRQNAGDYGGIVIYIATVGAIKVLTVYCGTLVLGRETIQFPLNVWNHVEVNVTGNKIYTFRNGVQVNVPNTWGQNMVDGRMFLGQANAGGGSGFNWIGQMDDVQLIKGQALHTTNFTPPTSAFPNS